MVKMKKKHKATGKIVNRRAKFDYELGDSFVVGIVLSGREAKSLRQGHAQLRGSYVIIKDSAKGGELWLVNATISDGTTFIIPESEQTRNRKLLAHRKEIEKFSQAKKEGNSIIPTEFLTASKHIKLRISIGKGKKRYDKRETLKRKDQERDVARASR